MPGDVGENGLPARSVERRVKPEVSSSFASTPNPFASNRNSWVSKELFGVVPPTVVAEKPAGSLIKRRNKSASAFEEIIPDIESSVPVPLEMSCAVPRVSPASPLSDVITCACAALIAPKIINAAPTVSIDSLLTKVEVVIKFRVPKKLYFDNELNLKKNHKNPHPSRGHKDCGNH